jgi:hypothetical protein
VEFRSSRYDTGSVRHRSTYVCEKKMPGNGSGSGSHVAQVSVVFLSEIIVLYRRACKED